MCSGTSPGFTPRPPHGTRSTPERHTPHAIAAAADGRRGMVRRRLAGDQRPCPPELRAKAASIVAGPNFQFFKAPEQLSEAISSHVISPRARAALISLRLCSSYR